MQSRSPRRGSQPASKKANRKKPNPQTTQKRADRIGAFLLFALCFPFLCWGASLYAFPVSPPQPVIEAASSAPDTSASFPPPNTVSQDPTGPKVTLASLTNTPAAADSGSPTPATDTPASSQGFVGSLGHVTDAPTGLVYMRARYYDPAIGRFINEDPAGHGTNWYAYCNNNPVNQTDYSGLATMTGDGEADYDTATINTGFSALAGIVTIIAGYNFAQMAAADGVLYTKGADENTGQNQNENAITRRIAKDFGLTDDERDELHRAISKQGYDEDDIRGIAEDLVARRNNGQ